MGMMGMKGMMGVMVMVMVWGGYLCDKAGGPGWLFTLKVCDVEACSRLDKEVGFAATGVEFEQKGPCVEVVDVLYRASNEDVPDALQHPSHVQHRKRSLHCVETGRRVSTQRAVLRKRFWERKTRKEISRVSPRPWQPTIVRVCQCRGSGWGGLRVGGGGWRV